jgi:hypothetical protein
MLAAMLFGAACGDGRTPVAPSPPAPPPSSAPYTISGTVTAFRGGPIEGMTVVVTAVPVGTRVETQTDARGRYSLPGPAATQVSVAVSSPSGAAVRYTGDSRGGLPAVDQTVDFVLHRKLSFASIGSSTLTGAIYGDEVIPDTAFGGRCVSVACVLVDVDCCGSAPGIGLTLSWDDPSSELVVYLPVDYTAPGVPGTRVCCRSPLSTIFYPTETSVVAIGFERVRGAVPGANDVQKFQLMARPRP